MRTKERALLEDCVIPYHDMFRSQELSMHLKKYLPTLERLAQVLAEEACAHASQGRYRWEPQDHADYSDHSDHKTGTVHPRTQNHGQLEVSGLTTLGGGEKQGSLRIVAYNKLKMGALDYFYVPKTAWSWRWRENSRGAGRLMCSYNLTRDSYDWLDNYRHETMASMARA